MAEYSDHIFCEKPLRHGAETIANRRALCPSVCCMTGLSGMPGAPGFERNIWSEYSSTILSSHLNFLSQSFTAPSVIPPTKYFCKNGYTTRIGTVATTVMAMRTDIGDTAFFICPIAAAWGSTLI